ncbi:MAG: cytochrome c [Acidobacteriaceae bacterium]|nr:cytochrome c [Acidobacteriaceae bacterium]
MKRISSIVIVAFSCLLATACRRDMQDQPKYKPLAASNFFADGRDSRPLPAHVIARDELDDVRSSHTGAQSGTFLETIPEPVSAALLQRGRDRFDIYCSPCHGRTGDGNGMIHQRGFWIPSNLHTERLRAVPPGYLFQVISNGYGAMPDYRDQVAPHDRWAIVAYLRALQLSQHATLADVPPEARQQLTSGASR